jgi:hypothetical protein
MSCTPASTSFWETLTAVGTLAAVAVALFGESFWRWWRRPGLSAAVRPGPPDCHKTPIRVEGVVEHAYYFRLWIENNGRGPAEQVQVFVSRLLRRDADGEFRQVSEFLPMYLRWTHVDELSVPRIQPGMGRHCELGRVLERWPVGFELLLEVAPLTGRHVLPSGTYRLELRIAAANAAPVSAVFELAFDGVWRDDEADMLRDGVGIRRV